MWARGGLGPGRGPSVLLLAAALNACSESPSAADASVDVPPMYLVPSCPRPTEAPLRTPQGEERCTRVGADPDPSSGDWPSGAGDTAPTVYVRAGATAGSGSRESPFGDVATALAATPAPRTIYLAAGTYPLASTLHIDRPLTLRGMGHGATTLVGPRDAVAVQVGTAGGPALAVTLARFAVRYETPPTPSMTESRAAILALGGQTVATLQGVSITRGYDGVSASGGATVCAEGLSVYEAEFRGVAAIGGGALVLRDLLVRGGRGVGVSAVGARVDIRTGLVASNAGGGVAILGAPVNEAPCASDADCLAIPGCAGVSQPRRCVAGRTPQGPRRCSTTTLSDLALLGNGTTGLRAEREGSGSGPVVVGERLVVGATGAPGDGGAGGDGVFVGPEASVTLDPSITSDAMRARGSQIIGNARTGVLVSNAGGTPSLPNLMMAGARVASNRGPGVYVQNGSFVGLIGYSVIADNAALGVGVTAGAGLGLLLCDQFLDTRPGLLRPANGQPFSIGDGLSMSEGTGNAHIEASEFNHNDRFGLLLSASNVTLQGANRGEGNGFRPGVYGGAVTGSYAAIDGLRAAPTMRPSLASGDLQQGP